MNDQDKHKLPPELQMEIKNYVTDRMNDWIIQFGESMNQTVSGVVQNTIQEAMKEYKVSFDKYVVDDMKWKERANPAVDFFVNVTWSKKFILAIIGFLATILGFIALLKASFPEILKIFK